MRKFSKLPDVGTTIFTVMSQRAAELGAVNLGQGFPDYPVDPQLLNCISEAMRAGHNQYAPMIGVAVLREWIASDLAKRRAVQVDAQHEITITLGATEAIYSAVQALVGAGDEVLVFDPAYDSYDPAVRLAGARCVHVPLLPPTFQYDWQRVRQAITPQTRLMIINSPHNPACVTLSLDDLNELAALAEAHDLLVISDEVYEHIAFGSRQHHSVLNHPSLRARAVVVYSFGKALHATGLRVGYAIAPAALTTELRKVHQFNTFTIATAFQQGIADYLRTRPETYTRIAPFFAAKLEILVQGLKNSALQLLQPQGSYFALIDYSGCERLAMLDDMSAAKLLLEEGGVASIPLAPFYQVNPPHRLLRLCFAKSDESLTRGVQRLRAFAEGPLA